MQVRCTTVRVDMRSLPLERNADDGPRGNVFERFGGNRRRFHLAGREDLAALVVHSSLPYPYIDPTVLVNAVDPEPDGDVLGGFIPTGLNELGNGVADAA